MVEGKLSAGLKPEATARLTPLAFSIIRKVALFIGRQFVTLDSVKDCSEEKLISHRREREYAMQSPIDYKKVAPEVYRSMLNLEKTINSSGLEDVLLDLLRLRVSQINRCAFCIDMHAKDLRARGESEARVYMLNAWRESPLYTERERLALEWAESLTEISQSHPADEMVARARRQFSEAELVNLTLAVVSINGWNRLNIAFRVAPGDYQPMHLQKAPD
jgi:AhpD family alkylhydroperoxidase